METATFGGGCFWCLEAVFLELKGVHSVKSGYAGGRRPNPTYEQVCAHRTGHAEVIRIEFDPAVVSLERLLEYFWHVHNPTQVGGQGNDRGPQYRSIILYANDAQKTMGIITSVLVTAGYLQTFVVPKSVIWAAYIAIAAGKKALEAAGRDGKDVDLFVIATSTPDDTFPSTASKVQGALGRPGAPSAPPARPKGATLRRDATTIAVIGSRKRTASAGDCDAAR